MLLCLRFGKSVSNGDEVRDCEQSDGVLVVRGELAVQWDDVVDDVFVLSTRSNRLGEWLDYQHCILSAF